MGASISACGRYRYVLTRGGGAKGNAIFVMLNPSTADARDDDPTVRRCRTFARDFGYDGLTVVNLYAFRATNPRDMMSYPGRVGPDNDYWLGTLIQGREVVCAWGANAEAWRVAEFCTLAAKAGASLTCIGVTKSGAPRHPLYLKSGSTQKPWLKPN